MIEEVVNKLSTLVGIVGMSEDLNCHNLVLEKINLHLDCALKNIKPEILEEIKDGRLEDLLREEKEKRLKNRRKVNQEILETMIKSIEENEDFELPAQEYHLKFIIAEIIRGKIPNLSIKY